MFQKSVISLTLRPYVITLLGFHCCRRLVYILDFLITIKSWHFQIDVLEINTVCIHHANMLSIVICQTA